MLTLVLALNSVLLLADLVLLVRMLRAQKSARRKLERLQTLVDALKIRHESGQ